MLAVGRRDLLGQGDDEPTVLVDLGRRGLALEESYRIAEVLQSVLLQFLRGVIVGVIPLGLGGDDLVQQLALAVLLTCLDIGLGDGDGLAERAPVGP